MAGSPVEDAVRLFTATFDAPPAAAAAAPGRVNLIGDHTDYNGGYVLPVAIDRDALVLIRPARRSWSTLRAADLGDGVTQIRLAGDERPEAGSFASYLVGVARLLAEAGYEVPEVDLLLTSEIPIASGLSSSAAIEVATATAFEQLIGSRLPDLDKAMLCQRAEHDYAGTPCGLMDQIASIAGRSGHALLIDCRRPAWEAVPLPDPSVVTLMVVDTKTPRTLPGSVYGERRATCVAAAAALGLGSLRDADADALESPALTEVQRRRARHVVQENQRVLDAADTLRSGDLTALGRLMLASHESLRDLYEVSCPELETVVSVAMQTSGVIGARMTGAGLGGCVVVMCRPDAAEAATRAVVSGFTAAHDREPAVFAVQSSNGARPIHPSVA